MQHPTLSAALADQHRDELSRQASDARLARSRRPNGRSQWRAPAGGGRPPGPPGPDHGN